MDYNSAPYLDSKDIVQYSCVQRDRPRRIISDFNILMDLVDRPLLRYFELQFMIKDRDEEPIPEELMDEILAQVDLAESDRKYFFLPLPRSQNHVRCESRFAYAAKMDLLCRQMFLPKNAVEKMAFPEFSCTHFSPEFWVKKKSVPDIQLPPFELEDYMLFEYKTATSFLVETAAALDKIENNECRKACTAVVKERLFGFVEMPWILGRIAIMRQSLLHAVSCINWQQMHGVYDFEADCRYQGWSQNVEEIKISLMKDAANFAFDQVWKHVKEPAQGTFQSDETLEKLQPECDTIWKQIKSIEGPVDIAGYLADPQYGPVAFCNANHEGVSDRLCDIREFNKSVHRGFPKKANKEWKTYVELYRTVQKYRTSMEEQWRQNQAKLRSFQREALSQEKG